MSCRRSLRKTFISNLFQQRPDWLFDELCWKTWAKESRTTDAAPNVYRKSFARTLKNGFPDFKSYYLTNIDLSFSGIIVRAAAYRIGGVLCSQHPLDSDIQALCTIIHETIEPRSHFILITFYSGPSRNHDQHGYMKLALNLPITLVCRSTPSREYLEALCNETAWTLWRGHTQRLGTAHLPFSDLYKPLLPTDPISRSGKLNVAFTTSTRFSSLRTRLKII